MALKLTVAPENYPVTLEEAKAHLRLGDSTDEDPIVEALIAAATEQAEIFTARRFVEQTWKLYGDTFSQLTTCGSAAIQIPYPPLVEIDSVKYYDTQGTLRTLVEDTDYQVETFSEPARISPMPGTVWPSTEANKLNAVEISFICGYVDDDVDTENRLLIPYSIRAAILLILAHLFEHRQEFVVGSIIAKIPMTSEWLLYPYRDLRL